MKNNMIEVQNIKVNITNINDNDYICISDIAKVKSDKSRAADVIRNWLRNRGTLDFLTAWEQLYNPNFKVFESEHFRKQVGLLVHWLMAKELFVNILLLHILLLCQKKQLILKKNKINYKRNIKNTRTNFIIKLLNI